MDWLKIYGVSKINRKGSGAGGKKCTPCGYPRYVSEDHQIKINAACKGVDGREMTRIFACLKRAF